MTAFTAAPSARGLLHYQGTVVVEQSPLLLTLLFLQCLPLAAGCVVHRFRLDFHSHLEHLTAGVMLASGLSLAVSGLAPVVPHMDRLVGGRGLAAIFLSMITAVILGLAVGGRTAPCEARWRQP